MERKFKQIYSTIASIPTKQKITSHLNSLNKKKKETLMYDVGNQVLAWSRHRQPIFFFNVHD
jgi:uncharacterized membrane protein YgaE (UPF0421/DUF939 family)